MHDATKKTKKKRDTKMLQWFLDNQKIWNHQGLSNEEKDKICFLMRLNGISHESMALFDQMREKADMILGDRHDYYGQI